MERVWRDRRGFTLIELVIVVGLLGLVMAAVYSLYGTHQKAAYSQAEVVDVQQNLRVAMDTISRDIRMAGVMIAAGTNQTFASPAGFPPFPTYSSNVRINAASAEARFARVAPNPATLPSGTGNYTLAAGSTITLTVEAPATATSPNIVDGFADGDNVRIVRPVDGSEPVSPIRSLVVSGTPDRGVFGTTSPTLTLKKSDNSSFTAGDVLVPGDMIVKVGTDAAYPMTVDYYMVGGGVTVNGYTCPNNQQCLVRQVNGTAADIVATELSSLRFSYLSDSGAESNVPPADLTKVRAVRITLQGATAKTAVLSGAPRSRTLTTIVKLRNRR